MNTTAFKNFINKLSERSDIEIHSIDIGQPASAAVLDDYKGEIPTELLEFYAVMNGCHLYASFKQDRNLEVGINIPAIEYLHAFRPADQTNLNIDEKFIALEFEWIENNYSPFYYVMPQGETDVNQSTIMRLELFPERHMVKVADSLENWMEKAADAGLAVGWASPDFYDNVTRIKKLLSTSPNNNDSQEPIGENDRKTVNRQFKDVNFKISIIGTLHELGYYVEEAERIQSENADWDQSHKPIPAVLEFYTNLEIDQNYLDEIEGLYPDGGDLCYQYLFNEWDGEDNQFDIESIEGIELLTNLKIFEPISMITDDGLDYAPLLLCKNLEKAAPEFIDDDEDGILQQLKGKGVETGDRHSKQNNEVSISEPVTFDAETKRILVFYLNEFEERFGKLEMEVSETVYESPFYIYDSSLKSQGPKFPDEKDISDEDCRTGFEILDKIWLDIARSSAMYYSPIFKKEPNPENNKYFLSCSYGFAPGYDLNAAIENIARYDFVVVRWEDFWDTEKNTHDEINHTRTEDLVQETAILSQETDNIQTEQIAEKEVIADTPGHYYAHAIDNDGKELEIPVSEDGAVQISSTQKIKSLKTNALKVFCRNNELEVLEAPNALAVGCNKNKIRKLWLENAENVNCAENQLTELHAPKATHVRCQLNQLTQLTLESVLELECYANKELTFLRAPKLRKIDCEIKNPESQEVYTSVQEIEIELRNRFDPKDTSSYDISTIDVGITIDLHKELLVEDLSFTVALQQEDFYSNKESGDEVFDSYLMRQNIEFGQQEKILAQAPELPMMLTKRTQLEFSIPIVSFPDKHQNLLDAIKQAPNRILEYHDKLILHITFYLNPDRPGEKYDYRMFEIKNPFYKTGIK